MRINIVMGGTSGKKRIAILQSNYIPWKGYFDIIRSVDEFIIYDDVQFTKNDWRNRNKIKTRNGWEWITIPVRHISLSQTIKDTKIENGKWAKKHWTALMVNYARATYFKHYAPVIKELYMSCASEYLSDINHWFITGINGILGITTSVTRSSDYDYSGNRNERLVNLCKRTGAGIYISGPAARGYLDERLFSENDIDIEWFDYSGYPEYDQLFPPFLHEVSILDLVFNTGPLSVTYLDKRTL